MGDFQVAMTGGFWVAIRGKEVMVYNPKKGGISIAKKFLILVQSILMKGGESGREWPIINFA